MGSRPSAESGGEAPVGAGGVCRAQRARSDIIELSRIMSKIFARKILDIIFLMYIL
jgi:hypothetical protein